MATTTEQKPAPQQPAAEPARAAASGKRHIETGILYVLSTYNNTKVTLTDNKGNTIAFASAGGLGFSGAKKGTPFAAAKVGETVGERAKSIGLREVAVVVKGVGAGRESSIRSFAGKGIGILRITDATPIPHNGPRPPRARRV